MFKFCIEKLYLLIKLYLRFQLTIIYDTIMVIEKILSSLKTFIRDSEEIEILSIKNTFHKLLTLY